MKEFVKAIMNLFPKKEDALDGMLREKGIDPEDVLVKHRRMREEQKAESEKSLDDDE